LSFVIKGNQLIQHVGVSSISNVEAIKRANKLTLAPSKALTQNVATETEGLLPDQAFNQAKQNNELPLEEIKTFVDVFMQIKARYVDKISDKELIEKAIKGMVDGLDNHSEYLGNTTFEKLTNDTKGQFGGVGVEISLTNEGLLVNRPIKNTPATDADIRAGDVIIKMGTVETKGINMDKAKEVMRGKPGEPLTLMLKRDGEEDLLEKTVIRDVIQLETVKSVWLSKQIAYIRLSQFQSASTARLRDEIFDLQKSKEETLEALVLDLRGNPGGLLTSAVSVADIFLDGGIIVSTKSRNAGISGTKSFEASPKDFTNGIPLVVLINSDSASAAEIVSGALQDNGRAKIIGVQSYGKGSVQSLINLSDSRALKLTTGRYYTPSGESIHEKGITPDIIVDIEQATATETDAYDAQVQASLNFLNSRL